MTSGFTEILKDNPGVQVVVGLNGEGTKYKVFPVIAPQDEKPPYITVFQNQNDALASLTKKEESQLDYPRVTVNCWAKNFRTAELMGEAVRAAVDNQGFDTDAGYLFNRIWMIDDRDGYDQDRKMHVHIQVFGVEYKRTAGAVYNILQARNFVGWGGLWNWANHSNALPSGTIQEGTMWITEGDIDLGGRFIPDGALMTAKVGDPSSITDFSFNL